MCAGPGSLTAGARADYSEVAFRLGWRVRRMCLAWVLHEPSKQPHDPAHLFYTALGCSTTYPPAERRFFERSDEFCCLGGLDFAARGRYGLGRRILRAAARTGDHAGHSARPDRGQAPDLGGIHFTRADAA